MSITTAELEVSSSLPASKLFKAFLDFDNIVLKLKPQIYKDFKYIQGSGEVGSIKKATFGDDVPFTTSTHRVDAIDPSNYTFSLTVFEGDALLDIVDTLTHQMKFIPSSDGGCVYKHTFVFKCKGDDKIPEDAVKNTKDSFKDSFKMIESYVNAHLEDY